MLMIRQSHNFLIISCSFLGFAIFPGSPARRVWVHNSSFQDTFLLFVRVSVEAILGTQRVVPMLFDELLTSYVQYAV